MSGILQTYNTCNSPKKFVKSKKTSILIILISKVVAVCRHDIAMMTRLHCLVLAGILQYPITSAYMKASLIWISNVSISYQSIKCIKMTTRSKKLKNRVTCDRKLDHHKLMFFHVQCGQSDPTMHSSIINDSFSLENYFIIIIMCWNSCWRSFKLIDSNLVEQLRFFRSARHFSLFFFVGKKLPCIFYDVRMICRRSLLILCF